MYSFQKSLIAAISYALTIATLSEAQVTLGSVAPFGVVAASEVPTVLSMAPSSIVVSSSAASSATVSVSATLSKPSLTHSLAYSTTPSSTHSSTHPSTQSSTHSTTKYSSTTQPPSTHPTTSPSQTPTPTTHPSKTTHHTATSTRSTTKPSSPKSSTHTSAPAACPTPIGDGHDWLSQRWKAYVNNCHGVTKTVTLSCTGLPQTSPSTTAVAVMGRGGGRGGRSIR